MTRAFQPSYGVETSEPDYLETLKKYAPIIAPFVAAKDPRETVEVLKAKIANYEAIKHTSPFNVIPGVRWYDAEIAKMKARLDVAKRTAGETQAGAEAVARWHGLGQTALGIGIATGVALLALVVVKTVKEARS
jgi:hypothetical protein